MKKFRIPFIKGLHRCTCWEPEYYRKERQKPILKQWFKIKKNIANLYDTEAIIEVAEYKNQDSSLWRNDITV